MDGSNNDDNMANINAGDSEIKVVLGEVDGGGDSNDCGGVDTNDDDDTDYGNGHNKVDCDDDLGSCVGDNSKDGNFDDGDVDSNGGNDANREDEKKKVDCRKDSASDDDNNNVDNGPKMMVMLMLMLMVGWSW